MTVILSSEEIDAAFERMVATGAAAAASDQQVHNTAAAYQGSRMFQLSLSALGREVINRIRESVVNDGDEYLLDVFRSFQALGIMFFEAGYTAAITELESTRQAS